jgi:hypothetical protein
LFDGVGQGVAHARAVGLYVCTAADGNGVDGKGVGPDVGAAIGAAVGAGVGAAVSAAVGAAVGIDDEAHALKHAEAASVVSGPFTEHRVRGRSATHAQFFIVSPEEAATLAETGVGLRGCACAGAAHVT